ncbi:hydroxyacylglutathione hydrolase [Sulfidibacter corallicola]|uniref:Hydroxyacylglutathione hydrolase n=1 Tax=Sulfidibacter corallicola TaxID=2818388 RepID=A0A8A4TWN0_SULCO|nr:hydroxyacylglutathione hydrolase [Sulfidibacter corallicola]QTD53534.1 hydroxyacylglutathione hydrolase [Sulfidibacter corallicola]
MDVIPIPCLRDNYAYLLICEQSGEVAVVDPSESEPVLAELRRRDLSLNAILNTHHHWDHVGGNKALLATFPGIQVFGHASDRGRIPGQTHFLEEGDTVAFGGQRGSITHNPGHTTGAITYYFGDAAFTGDTLFSAGCGRLFEGTPADMYRSLNEKIGGHPDETRLYFGHEYTESNLRFALTVEPNNTAVQERLEEVRDLRARGEWTTPSTLAREWAVNPFMRCDSAEIIETVQRHEPGTPAEPVAVLAVVRGLKDRF